MGLRGPSHEDDTLSLSLSLSLALGVVLLDEALRVLARVDGGGRQLLVRPHHGRPRRRRAVGHARGRQNGGRRRRGRIGRRRCSLRRRQRTRRLN